MENSFHTNDMNVASPLYELSGVSSGLKPTKMSSRIDHMSIVSLQCGSLHVLYCYKHEPHQIGRGGGVATIYSRDVQIRSRDRKSGPITWFQTRSESDVTSRSGLGYICIYILIIF